MQVQVAAVGTGERLPSRASVNAEVTLKQFIEAAQAWSADPAAAPAAATAAAAAAAAVIVPPAVKDNLPAYRTFFLGFVAVARLDEIMGGGRRLVKREAEGDIQGSGGHHDHPYHLLPRGTHHDGASSQQDHQVSEGYERWGSGTIAPPNRLPASTPPGRPTYYV